MSTAVWVAIITGLTTLLGGGAVVAWIKSKTQIKLREMEEKYKEHDRIRGDVEDLKKKFDNLYSKYLQVLKEHTVLQADHQVLKNRMNELRGYKSQTMKIGRLTKALNQYYKDNDLDALKQVFDKELIQ